MLPSAGSSSRAEEAAILEEAKAVSSVRGAAAGGGGRGDGVAAAGARGGRGRGNSGRAQDALPESPTRGGEDELPAEGAAPCFCVESLEVDAASHSRSSAALLVCSMYLPLC